MEPLLKELQVASHSSYAVSRAPLVHPGNLAEMSSQSQIVQEESLHLHSWTVSHESRWVVAGAVSQGGRPYQEDCHSLHAFAWQPGALGAMTPTTGGSTPSTTVPCSPVAPGHDDARHDDVHEQMTGMPTEPPAVGRPSQVGAQHLRGLEPDPTPLLPSVRPPPAAHVSAALMPPAAPAAEEGAGSGVWERPAKSRRVSPPAVQVPACPGACGAHPALHAGEEVLMAAVYDGHGGPEVARCAARHMVEHVVQGCQHVLSAECSPQSVSPRSVLPDAPVGSGAVGCLAAPQLCRALNHAALTFDAWLTQPAHAQELYSLSQQLPPGGAEQDNGGETTQAGIPAVPSSYGRLLPDGQTYVGPAAGSTALMALLSRDLVTVACVGDSKAWASCEGSAGLVTLSVDHKATDPGEEARIRKAGGWISRSGRVNAELDMSRALGDFEFKQAPGLGAVEQAVIPVPDVVTLDRTTQRLRWLLLCSDGLSNACTENEVKALVEEGLAAGRDPEVLCRALCVRACTSLSTVFDNVTVVLVVPTGSP